MIGVREAIEQAIFVSVGAAALTVEKAEAVVSDLVSRGHLGADDGLAVVTRLMARVRGEGPPAQSGLMGRLESGAQVAFQEIGVARTSDLEDLRMRIAELEHRVRQLEPTLEPEGLYR